MAMNKARRTANLNNILTYDTLGNSTLIANLTVEGLTGAGFVKADAAGLLSVDTAAYTVVTGATNYLTKITAPNTLGQSLVYDNGTSVLVNTAVGVPGYSHAFQVMANGAGGLVVSTTDVASAIGIVNSSSANKTWDISPYGNHLVINESGIATRMKFDAGGNITIGDITNTGHKLEVVGSFRTTGTNTLSALQGVGDRMVVANTNGVLTTQPIPTGSITGTGAAGQVNFWTGTTTVSGSNNLFWDNSLQRLSITGTNASDNTTLRVSYLNATFSINNVSGTYANASLSSTNLGGSVSYGLTNNSSFTGSVILYNSNESNNLFGSLRNNSFAFLNISATKFYIGNFNASDLIFGTTNLERMRLFAGGNFSIGTTSDLGVRLGVVGDTLLRGSGNTNTTTALTVQNSDGTNMWRFANDGRIAIGTSGSIIYPAENINQSGALSISGTGLQFAFSKSTQEGYGLYIRSTAAAQRTNTTGDAGIIDMFHGFAPTSGNGTYHMIKVTGTINQTGGANGITRGLYINPNLIAAADWRSIEWSNNSGWGLYGAGTAANYLNGSLSIGTTSQLSELTVEGINKSGTLTLSNSDGTILTNETVGQIDFYTKDFSGISNRIVASIRASADTDYTGGNAPTSLRFFTQTFDPTGVGFPATEKMRLDASGNLGIGTTPTALTDIGASTTTRASLRLREGVAPTTPNNGDIWSTTTDLLARINGTTYSLINSGLSGSGTAGQVTYWDSASNITGSNNLFWDNANGRLGIGTNTPASSLHITSAATFATGIQLNNAGSIGFIWGDGSSMNIRPGATHGIQISAGSAGLLQATATTGGFRIELQALLAQPIYTYFSDNDTGIGRAAADTLTFHAGGERARFSTVGNFSIGAITDGGQRLQVYGDTLLRGSGNTSATTALSVQNSDSSNMLQILNNGYIRLGNLGNPSFRIYSSTVASGGDVDLNGEFLTLNSRSVSTETGSAAGFIHINGVNAVAISGIQNVVSIQKGFAPTSGSAIHTSLIINPNINQTGGANGVTRGVYVNPTLTAAADWRSIQWDNNTGWGLYGAGTANNYLAGRLGIGSTSLANTTVRVGNNITGATSHFSVFASQTVLSDVANASIFTTEISTQATAFTLNTLRHYRATKGTFGAGSIVANQYGFFAESTLTDATNNYGFWGDIASGTGRWNLYMNGTALNYINSKLLIGYAVDQSVSSVSSALQISGTTNESTTAHILRNSNDAVGAVMRLAKTRSASNGGFTVVQDGDRIGSIAFAYADGSAFRPASALIGAEVDGTSISNVNSPGRLVFYTTPSGSTTSSERMRLNNAGNLLINSTTDSGQRLQVIGDTLLRGSGATSATTALTVQNSGSTDLMTVRNDGLVVIQGSLGFGTDSLRATIFAGSTSNRGIIIQDNSGVTGGVTTLTVGNNTKTGTLKPDLNLNSSWTPTTSTFTYAKLSLTGTYTELAGQGASQGIYINTTIGATTNYRAIEWTNNNGWGLYGSGTATNYLNGSLLIGSATDDTVNKLQVTGTIVAGSGLSTTGSVILRGSYTVGYLTILGTDASSGGPMLSYGIQSAQNSTAGAFVSSSGITIQRSAYVQNGGHIWYTAPSSSTAIGTAVVPTKHMELYNSGNLVLGGGADDAVNRLQVGGNAFIKGTGNTSATFALTVQNSDSTNIFRISNDGYIRFGLNGFAGFFPTNDGGNVLATGRGIRFTSNLSTQAQSNFYFTSANTLTGTSGNQNNAFFYESFLPTSGTATFSQLQLGGNINQTGGANGVTRGLYVNPTLTAAADWRSIEWSNNTGWGLYGVGTAKNYLNGTTLIGTTTDDGINKLQVAGSIASAGIMRSDAARTAATNDVSIALLGSNITTYTAGFSMGAAGYGLNAIYAQHEQRFGGNATFDAGNLNGAGLMLNRLAPTAAGTITMNQQAGRIRTMSNLHLQTQIQGNNNITVTHMSGLHIYGHYRTTGTITLTVGDYYGVLLADPNEFSTGPTITGTNWGFYQQGAAPINAFEGSMLVGTTTTDANNRLVVSGNTRVTGNMTAAQLRLSALNTAPATSTSAGTTGEIRIDADNIYVCTATNTWKRAAIATF